jgi:pyridoxamine 5'-phosphate oxidase
MSDPILRFRELFERALGEPIAEPTACALATADAAGRPSVRMVLLKGFDERGFVIFTNLESRKALELKANPWAALCFFWQPLEAQVRVEGAVDAVSASDADDYFALRARGSRIGAWSSLQSRPLASRAELEKRIRQTEARFGDGEIPRPPFWSGFRVIPDRIEFWSGQPSRLHDRELYTRTDDGWRVERLYP